MIAELISKLNNALYSYILIILLIAAGLYFTVRTRAAQFTTVRDQLRVVMEKPTDGKGVSSFRALMVSTASRVGTGNIIGVSTALCLGCSPICSKLVFEYCLVLHCSDSLFPINQSGHSLSLHMITLLRN